ncbi:ABC transporter permease subunit [Nonomuraea rubra]|uniref:ABC transporter permease subunit n=1 Tax=Nonomuraea rubra TaxID=46180 RepID=UPI003615BB7E
MRRRHGFGVVLLAVPLVLALAGPWLAGTPEPRGVSFSAGGPLGTDFVGRDVWEQVLLGGRSVVVVAVLATLLAYAGGVPLGLLAGLAAAPAGRRWVDEVLMRPLDLLLAVPSLLLLVMLAALLSPGPAALVVIVGLIGLPEVVRISRAAALRAAGSTAMEALRLQGRRGGGGPSGTPGGRCSPRWRPTWACAWSGRCTWWPRPASWASASHRTPATGPSWWIATGPGCSCSRGRWWCRRC